MPHVDEGTLHALLDGALRAEEPARADAVEAHLAACADCRALLEEASVLRGRAADVLTMLEPAVAAPDFNEVLVRAGRDSVSLRGGLARQARWTRGVAWAATITIALGTGYLIRDRLVPERAAMTLEAERSRSEVPPPLARPVPTVDPAADASDAAREAGPEETQTARGAEMATSDDLAPAAGGMPEPEVEVAERFPRRRIQLRTAAPGTALATASGPREVSPEVAGALLGAPLLVLPNAEVAGVTAEMEAGGAVVVSLQRVGDVEIRVTQTAAAETLPGSAVAEAEEGAPLGQPIESAPAPVAGFAPPAAADRARVAALSAARAVRMEAASGAAADSTAVVRSVRVRVDASELVLAGPLPLEALRLLAVGASPYQPRP